MGEPMGRYEDLIDAFYALHAEEDPGRRAALLDEAIADDIVFLGLQTEAVGRKDFEVVFRDGGTHLARTTPVDEHRGWLRCGWELRNADGSVATADDGRPYAGIQISEVGPDGRLRKIIPFLGLAPPAER